jgi:hypothetical protein
MTPETRKKQMEAAKRWEEYYMAPYTPLNVKLAILGKIRPRRDEA